MKLSSTAILALAISSITATAYAETQSQDFVPTHTGRHQRPERSQGFHRRSSLGGIDP